MKRKQESHQVSAPTANAPQGANSTGPVVNPEIKEQSAQTPLSPSQKVESPTITPTTLTPTATKTPESKKPVDEKFKSISTYNGGRTERYVWSQGIADVMVQIDLPLKPLKAKDLEVRMTSSSIKAVVKSTKQVLIDGDFYDTIKVEDSTWAIEEGERLMLNLEKIGENIWKTVIKGDQEIDATKVDNTKNLEDFDDETQGALRKIMYEQNRKMRGLPTSEEEKQHEMLRKAWDAEGSPFKGQPFDPSRLNLPVPGNNLGGGFQP